jgi:hypothetical protein
VWLNRYDHYRLEFSSWGQRMSDPWTPTLLMVKTNAYIIVAGLLAIGSVNLVQYALGQPMVYGGQLLPPQERLEHRAKMPSLSPTERHQYQAEHHTEMQKRAEEQGFPLPPMGNRSGQSFGRGPGMGMGRGYGYDPAT